MLLEELIEQHRVHRLVAHAVRLASLIACHQGRVHFLHLLGHQAKLRDTIRIKLFLIMEGDRLERENRFARLVHRLNRVLEKRRGYGRAKMTTGIYDNCYTCWNGCPTNPGDKCGSLGSLLADTNCLGFTSNASVAYLDIVTSGGQVKACILAQSHVERTGCIIMERILTVGGVVAAGCVAQERSSTGGRVGVAGCVAVERITTGGRIAAAGCVGKERFKTDCRVVDAGVVQERIVT